MSYFTLQEFVASEKARALKIDNIPDFEEVQHLALLRKMILDPLREAWGGPLYITSGYRCPKLNKAVGGSDTSAHPAGYAADVQPKDKRKIAAFILFANAWLEENKIKFDQAIDESDKTGTRWWHIALYDQKGVKQRRQYLTKTKA